MRSKWRRGKSLISNDKDSSKPKNSNSLRSLKKKEKQLEVNKKIVYLNELNQARLRSLKAREDAVGRIFNDAFVNLSSISQGPGYKDLLCDLIIQAALKLNESSAEVLCRQVDVSLVESVLSKACQRYKDLSGGKDLKLTLNHKSFLSPPRQPNSDAPSCAGGIVLSTAEGKILCSNTLEQRLSTAYEQLLPTIRTILFGRSLSRKYFD